MKYDKGEVVLFSTSNHPDQKGIILECFEYDQSYHIKFIGGKDHGKCNSIGESYIISSFNRRELKWTPTEESLPPEKYICDWVLVTMFYMTFGHPITMPAYYRRDDKVFEVNGVDYTPEEIIAWMPFPTPYDGDGSKGYPGDELWESIIESKKQGE